MTILSLDNSDVCPAFLKDFVKNGARLTKLEAILKATHGIVEASAPEDGDKTGDAGEYTGRELEFMISLQRRWRRLMPRIQEQRQLRKTGEGAMFLSLQDFCFTKLGTEVARGISAKEKIALRAFLFTDGLDLLIELERMHGNIQKLREIFKLKFASPASISQLEELAVIPAQFLHFELKLRTLRHVWSVKGLEQPNFLLPPVELRLRAREAQRAVKNLKQEISVVETKLSV